MPRSISKPLARFFSRSRPPGRANASLLLLALAAACSDAPQPTNPTHFPYDVPLDATSPWPKFRRDSAQTGRSPIRPIDDGSAPWSFATGNGIFSSPVIGGDGTVYIGSADRTFYALSDADGSVRWKRLTGEIIDSSALLDDQGQIYFGSGDGHLYAQRASDGTPTWTFTADDPSVNRALIRWFEGNVAIGTGGDLYAPNDNFFTYALRRDDASVLWRFKTADQTWSLPALDTQSNRLFIGNNFQIAPLPNIFSLDAATGDTLWSAGTENGTVAASPALDDQGRVFVGGFDGFLRAFERASGELLWKFGARDHIYASPALQPDGTVVQAAADGSVYGLDPASGALRWQFDSLAPFRSSPAVDADGNVYVGSGDGRLVVLDADGTLRWALRLIDDQRDDLNSSPALGRNAVVIGGENGDVFRVPYDYCLRPSAKTDPRCETTPPANVPDGASLVFTTRFGGLELTPPSEIDGNQSLTFSLLVREQGKATLAVIDSDSLEVTTSPATNLRPLVSGDRKFVTIVPNEDYLGASGGALDLRIRARTLVDLDRAGLLFSGGKPGPAIDASFHFTVRPKDGPPELPLPVPQSPGDPAGVWELYRIAAPLPTILPSYNQIGFDSIHYLVGLVDRTSSGGFIAWTAGAKLTEGENRTVIDPTTRVLFPLELSYDRGLLTAKNEAGFAVEFNAIRLPFEFFRVATRIDASPTAVVYPSLNVYTLCSGITFYGPFLKLLGLCNPETDILDVSGGANLRPFDGGVPPLPPLPTGVTFAARDGALVATVGGASIPLAEHAVGLLAVDADTERPLPLDYGYTIERSADADGLVREVRIPLGSVPLPPSVRVYLMIDTYPAARGVVGMD